MSQVVESEVTQYGEELIPYDLVRVDGTFPSISSLRRISSAYCAQHSTPEATLRVFRFGQYRYPETSTVGPGPRFMFEVTVLGRDDSAIETVAESFSQFSDFLVKRLKIAGHHPPPMWIPASVTGSFDFG